MSLYVNPSVQVVEVLEYLEVSEATANLFPNTELVRVRLRIREWEDYYTVVKEFSKSQWEQVLETNSYNPNKVYPKEWN